MASNACSPSRPAAADAIASRTSRMHCRQVSAKSCFFVPKRRKTYGWEMRARLATSSVDVPCRPLAANSTVAASRIDARRSSAVCRVEVVATAL